MNILNITEIMAYKKSIKEKNNKFKNIYQVVDNWLIRHIIEKTDYEKLLNTIKKINYQHHNQEAFENNYIKFFTLEEDGKKTIQAIVDHSNGSVLSGLELSENNTLILETAEMGVIGMVSENLDKNQIQEVINALEFLLFAFVDPLMAQKQMIVENNKNQLEKKLEVLKKHEVKKMKGKI